MINTKSPTDSILRSYEKQEGKNVFVNFSKTDLKSYKFIKGNFLSAKRISKNKADALSTNRSFIRHDNKRLSKAIIELL